MVLEKDLLVVLCKFETEILAAELEGFSGKNSLGLKMIGPSANLDKLIPIFSDVLTNRVFENSEIEFNRIEPEGELDTNPSSQGFLLVAWFKDKS